jgi:hypothetical protein
VVDGDCSPVVPRDDGLVYDMKKSTVKEME